MALPRGAHRVAPEAAAMTTRTMNPRDGGVDGKRRLRLFLTGLAGVAAAAVALAIWLPTGSRSHARIEKHGAEASPLVSETTGVADARPAAEGSAALSPPQDGAGATWPSGPVEHEQVATTARKATKEPVPAEGRRKKSGEGRKRPRLQFLDDGSPLLE